jgi:hypothetical protein
MEGEQQSTVEGVVDENLARQALQPGRRGAINRHVMALFDASRQELSSDIVRSMNPDYISGVDRKPAIFGKVNPEAELPELQNNVGLLQNARTAFANEDTLYAPGRGGTKFLTQGPALQFAPQPGHQTLNEYLFNLTGVNVHDVDSPARAKELEDDVEP